MTIDLRVSYNVNTTPPVGHPPKGWELQSEAISLIYKILIIDDYPLTIKNSLEK